MLGYWDGQIVQNYGDSLNRQMKTSSGKRQAHKSIKGHLVIGLPPKTAGRELNAAENFQEVSNLTRFAFSDVDRRAPGIAASRTEKADACLFCSVIYTEAVKIPRSAQ